MSNEFRPRCLIIGHSFIWRLAAYTLAPVKKGGIIKQGAINFDLKQCEVKYFSVSGGGLRNFAVTCESFNQLQRVCSEYQPHVIFLQVGENDITGTGKSVQRIASDILSLASFLVQGFGVMEVCIGELFTRPFPRYVSAQEYISCRQFVNQILKESIESGCYPNISFWKHRRIFYSPLDIFSHDGVHLNVVGNKKFYKNIRLALKLACERINCYIQWSSFRVQRL